MATVLMKGLHLGVNRMGMWEKTMGTCGKNHGKYVEKYGKYLENHFFGWENDVKTKLKLWKTRGKVWTHMQKSVKLHLKKYLNYESHVNLRSQIRMHRRKRNHRHKPVCDYVHISSKFFLFRVSPQVFFGSNFPLPSHHPMNH